MEPRILGTKCTKTACFQHSRGFEGYSRKSYQFQLPTEPSLDGYGQGKNTLMSSGYAPHQYFPAVANTHNCIDKKMHSRKRRIVGQGFSASALNSSEPVIIQHVESLCRAMTASKSERPGLSQDAWLPPRDMALWSELPTHFGRERLSTNNSASELSDPECHS